MIDENVKLGMKVVPHTKTPYMSDLSTSVTWLAARAKQQPFLYVVRYERYEGWWLLNDVEYPITGDYFLASDFEPYEEQ